METLKVGNGTIELSQGDITLQQVDAIVNAANSRLMGGGGVDGAIHRRGGRSIMEETDRRYPDGCPTGSAVISSAGNLQARYVIHAVGPVYRGGKQHEAELLAAAYQTSLKLAADHDCRSIALPALSTGAYRFPMAEAAKIALTTACDFLKANGQPSLIRFVLFDASAMETFQRQLAAC